MSRCGCAGTKPDSCVGAALPRADPAALGNEIACSAIVQQTDRRAVRLGGLRVLQQLGAAHAAAIELQSQHVVAERDALRVAVGRRRRGVGDRWLRGRLAGIGNAGRCRASRGRHGARRYRARAVRDLVRGRSGRRRRRILFLAPLHPQQGRHHQPGEDQERTGLGHRTGMLIGRKRPARNAWERKRSALCRRVGGGGNAPARFNNATNSARSIGSAMAAAPWRATST